MARQLAEHGEKVELLALINCSPPSSNYNRPSPSSLRWQIRFARNVLYWLGCFCFSWTMRERREFVRWKFSVLRKKVNGGNTQSDSELALTDLDELLRLSDYSAKQRELWQSHVRMLMAYRPPPYRGDVTLFRTRGHGLFTSFDDKYGWGELVQGKVDIRIMPGGHGNILDEPHVRVVAQALRDCLKETAVSRSEKEAAA
jgi:thioesterase domain-containing protein